MPAAGRGAHTAPTGGGRRRAPSSCPGSEALSSPPRVLANQLANQLPLPPAESLLPGMLARPGRAPAPPPSALSLPARHTALSETGQQRPLLAGQPTSQAADLEQAESTAQGATQADTNPRRHPPAALPGGTAPAPPPSEPPWPPPPARRAARRRRRQQPARWWISTCAARRRRGRWQRVAAPPHRCCWPGRGAPAPAAARQASVDLLVDSNITPDEISDPARCALCQRSSASATPPCSCRCTISAACLPHPFHASAHLSDCAVAPHKLRVAGVDVCQLASHQVADLLLRGRRAARDKLLHRLRQQRLRWRRGQSSEGGQARQRDVA